MSSNLTMQVKGVYFDNHMQRYVGKMSISGQLFRKGFKAKEDAVNYRKSLEVLAESVKKGDIKVCDINFPVKLPYADDTKEDKEVVTPKVIRMVVAETKGVEEAETEVSIPKERPKNFCVKNEIFDYTYHAHRQGFSKVDVSSGKGEIDSFLVEPINFRLIYQDNATIVILEDGSKGVAKCGKKDIFSRKAGLECAFARAMADHYTRKYSL